MTDSEINVIVDKLAARIIPEVVAQVVEKAPEAVSDKVTSMMYQSVGKSFIQRVYGLLGMLVVAYAVWEAAQHVGPVK